MTGFEVYLNGNKLCAAGVGASGVLTAGVTWGRNLRDTDHGPKKFLDNRTTLRVGGLKTNTPSGYDEFQDWVVTNIKLGDVVSVKVVDADDFDEPSEVRVDDASHREESRRQRYQFYKNEFEGGDAGPKNPAEGKEARTDIGFEVSVNDAHACTAGFAECGVITIILTWVSRESDASGEPASVTDLHVGGLTNSTTDGPGELLRWLDAELACGDHVSIKAIPTPIFDAPPWREQDDPRRKHEARESRRRAYETMKLEYEGQV